MRAKETEKDLGTDIWRDAVCSEAGPLCRGSEGGVGRMGGRGAQEAWEPQSITELTPGCAEGGCQGPTGHTEGNTLPLASAVQRIWGQGL